MSKRQDALRLRAIMQILTEPFEDPDMDYLTTETKLWYAMAPDLAPIYRRKILKSMPVKGLWWLNESQWVRFLWQGHKAQVIRGGQDQDKVLATRSFMSGGWCYIREHRDQIDIEAMSKVSKWCPIRKKDIGSAYEWLTCSITPEEYKKLDTYLSESEGGCRHNKDE